MASKTNPLSESMLAAARLLAEGDADNLDYRLSPQNPTGCFTDVDTQEAYYKVMGVPTDKFLSIEHRVMAVCFAAELLTESAPN